MAIRIPSKNTYDLKNQKVKNNIIDKVEVSEKNAKVVKDFDALVYSGKVETEDAFDGINLNPDTEILPIFSGKTSFESFSHFSLFYYYASAIACGIRPFYKTISLSIPRNENNKFIQDILSGVDKEGEKNIKSSVTYDYIEHPIITTATLIGGTSTDQTTSRSRYYLSSVLTAPFDIIKERRTSELPPPSIKTKYTLGGTTEISASVNLTNEENLSTAQISYNREKDTWDCSLKIMCGMIKFSHIIKEQGQSGSYPNSITEYNTVDDDYGEPTGYLVAYEPLNVQISLYGNIISIDVKNEKLVIGNENGKKPFSISDNELIQKSNYGITNSEAFSKVLDQYKNGKETATVRCSISDYYNDAGILEISPKKSDRMCFRVGDEVIPMVLGTDGTNRPMSLSADGTGKVFRVTGTKIFYDGAVWQELTLQET
jgi:hypothetical protein